MSGAIAIFVKTPGFSPLKTRLAVKLGQATAEAFHLAAAQAITETVKIACAKSTLQGYFAVAEQSALQHKYWQALNCVWQGEGGLGERMAHIYQTLLAQHDYVILIGADIPQITVANLLNSATWLMCDKQIRFTFGPSIDGGFWLLGGNAWLAKNIWTDVTYSTKETGSQFLTAIKKIGYTKTLATLADADEVADLLLIHKSLLKLKILLPAQRKLLHFLNTIML